MLVKFSNIEFDEIRYFKFLNFWTYQPDFKIVVQNAWDVDITGNSMRRLHQKLKLQSGALSLWSKEQVGNVYSKVKEWEVKMELL